MSTTLTFPCERRYQTTMCDAIAMAVVGQGFDTRRAAAAAAKAKQFLEGCVETAGAVISIEVADTHLTLASAGRSLVVDL